MMIPVSRSGTKTDEQVERELSLYVVWVKAHNIAKEEPNKSEQMRQVVISVEHVAKGAQKAREQMHAAVR